MRPVDRFVHPVEPPTGIVPRVRTRLLNRCAWLRTHHRFVSGPAAFPAMAQIESHLRAVKAIAISLSDGSVRPSLTGWRMAPLPVCVIDMIRIYRCVWIDAYKSLRIYRVTN